MEIENFKKWKKSSLWIPKDEKRGQRSIFASEKRYRKVLFRTPNPGSIFFCTLLFEGTMNMTWKILYEIDYHTEVWLLWCLLYRQVIWNYIRRKCEQISFYLVQSTSDKHGIPRQLSHEERLPYNRVHCRNRVSKRNKVTCLRKCEKFRSKLGKSLLVRKRVIRGICEVCQNNRITESLSTALSFVSVCIWGAYWCRKGGFCGL